jgi:predicted phage-related endonuclease
MKIVNIIQGTSAWHAHRAQHWNASDAPAMLGVSTNKTRGQLLREVATGIEREFSDYVQDKVISPGHAFEAQARALAEEIVEEDLYPCVGTNGAYSASFDGLTLLEDTAWEHKRLNEALREAMVEGCTGADLPEMYRVQMEHQAMVSGAERVLFMASKWDGDQLVEKRECWYTPDAVLRARIVAGWAQFEADIAAYQPDPVAEPAPIGRAPDQLPALSIQVTGMVTASNLAEFKANAMAVLGGINRDLQTDEDFANAEKTVSWCKGVEERLEATKQQVLGQTADIDAVFRTMDEVTAETRRIRLELDRLVAKEKESRRGEIISAGVTAVRQHIEGINGTLGAHGMAAPPSLIHDVAAAIKGKRSLSSMQDAVNSVVIRHKIATSQQADLVRANIAILAEHAEHTSLFADRVQLCATKQPEDLRNLVGVRIAQHQQRENERLAREREQIRQEEAAKLERQRATEELAEAQQSTGAELSPAAQQLHEAQGAQRFAERHPSAAPAPAASAPAQGRIKLGDINAWIAPMSVSADGLASLGFHPVGTDRAARLYSAAAFPGICAALTRVLTQVAPARAAQQQAA